MWRRRRHLPEGQAQGNGHRLPNKVDMKPTGLHHRLSIYGHVAGDGAGLRLALQLDYVGCVSIACSVGVGVLPVSLFSHVLANTRVGGRIPHRFYNLCPADFLSYWFQDFNLGARALCSVLGFRRTPLPSSSVASNLPLFISPFAVTFSGTVTYVIQYRPCARGRDT